MNAVHIEDDNELRHLKALRLRVGEQIMLTNGRGICAAALLSDISKNYFNAVIFEELPNFGETGRRFGLALGALDSRERMEFAIEKAVELGITDFFPLSCEYSQRKAIQPERLKAKILAAVKQCRRSILPVLHPAQNATELISRYAHVFDVIFLADARGDKPSDYSFSSALVLVGPEGGFSKKEIDIFYTATNIRSIAIAPRRLRAETAAIAACAIINAV